jgi:hypothetical protein
MSNIATPEQIAKARNTRQKFCGWFVGLFVLTLVIATGISHARSSPSSDSNSNTPATSPSYNSSPVTGSITEYDDNGNPVVCSLYADGSTLC